MIDQICNEDTWRIITKEIQLDHIRLFLTIPLTAVASVIKILKGTTARKLFMQFPELKQKLVHLWSPSYFAATAGNMSVNTIKKYIKGVEHIGDRR